MAKTFIDDWKIIPPLLVMTIMYIRVIEEQGPQQLRRPRQQHHSDRHRGHTGSFGLWLGSEAKK